MANKSPEDRIKELEERVRYLEAFLMESLVHRVYDLSLVVGETMPKNRRNQEVLDHIRHVMDEALVGGWADDGP